MHHYSWQAWCDNQRYPVILDCAKPLEEQSLDAIPHTDLLTSALCLSLSNLKRSTSALSSAGRSWSRNLHSSGSGSQPEMLTAHRSTALAAGGMDSAVAVSAYHQWVTLGRWIRVEGRDGWGGVRGSGWL